MNDILTSALAWLSGHLTLLTLFGFVGQGLFTMRFLAQWLSSEKAGRSVVPEIFWLFSFGGGLVLFIYAIFKNDLVFMVGQGAGLFIYARNIYFIHKNRQARAGQNGAELLRQLQEKTGTLSARAENLSARELKAVAEALASLDSAKK